MERITGKDTKLMMEAVASVYAPTISEEVINTAAEKWVAACIEEGIKFEEYTLDEITEAFIADCEQPEVLNEYFGMQGAQDFGANLRQKFGQARRAVGAGLSKFGAGVKDVAGATAQGLIGQKTTSQNPLARAGNLVTRMQTAIPRAGAALVGGFLTGKGSGTRPATPAGGTVASQGSATPAAPTRPAAPAKPTAAADPRNQQYVKDRAAIATAKTPEAKAAATKKAETTGMAAWAKANPKLAAKVKPGQAGYETIQRTLNPKPAATPATGAAPAAKPAATGTTPAAKPAATGTTPAAKPAATAAKPKVEVGSKNPADVKKKPVAVEETEVSASKQQLDEFLGKDAADAFDKASRSVQKRLEGMGVKINRQERGYPTKKDQEKKIEKNVKKEDFDIFDTIKEHLIGEGLTEQEAFSVMVVMDEQDREEILEGSCGSMKKKKKSKKGGY